MSLKLIALVLPLGLDTLGVALALGMAGLPPRQRLRISGLLAGFEAVMPLIGVALGATLGSAIGGVADYFAAALVAAIGIYMLLEDVGDDQEQPDHRLLSMTQHGFLGALTLGISVSLDELAIGFSAGLLRLPILTLVIAIGVQAFVVTQAGLRLGSRLSSAAPERAQKLAGVALLWLGSVLLIERLTA
ncbi:MAG: manganese efflux pump MntP [Solirubrobacteraceae bacterium]